MKAAFLCGLCLILFAPDDVATLVRLSEPETSPDGRAIAFRRWIEWLERYLTE